MSAPRFMNGLTATQTGAIINFGAASANVAIPNASDGNRPRWIRLASTQPCYVRIGTSGVTAAAGDLLVQPADAVILRAQSLTHVAAIQVTAGGVLQISPLEDL